MAQPLTLLQIVNTALDELGLSRTSIVVNSTNVQIRRLYALINRELNEQVKDKQWTALQTEFDLHVGQPTTTTCNTAQNSYQITNIPDTSTLMAGLFVCNAQNIPVDSRVASVDTPNQVTLTQPATGNGTNVPCVFAQDTYALPPSYDRFQMQTWWDRTNRWSLLGPDSPQIDQWHRSGVVTIGPRRHFRIIPGFQGADFSIDFGPDFNTSLFSYAFRIWPPPGATDTPLDLAVEYISSMAVVGSSGVNVGVAQTNFQADTDVCVLDSQMLILGAKWRMWQIQGYDYQPMQQEYIDYCERLYANDGGAKTLDMSQSRWSYLITSSNVQDGNWPGPQGTNSA